MLSLTPTQNKALQFICEHTLRRKLTPTLRELCAYMGYSAIGSAQDLAQALKKKGCLITNEGQSARGSLVPSEDALRAFRDDDQGDLTDFLQSTILVPCLGEVPAGNPVEAISEKIGDIVVSFHLLPKPLPPKDQLFAVRAKGDSMQNAGIMSGDWLVVRSCREADPGQIVVARLDDEVTVKRLGKDTKNGWFLRPENPKYTSTYAKDRPFEISGIVLNVQRFYA